VGNISGIVAHETGDGEDPKLPGQMETGASGGAAPERKKPTPVPN
jgi:hypothetical protein